MKMRFLSKLSFLAITVILFGCGRDDDTEKQQLRGNLERGQEREESIEVYEEEDYLPYYDEPDGYNGIIDDSGDIEIIIDPKGKKKKHDSDHKKGRHRGDKASKPKSEEPPMNSATGDNVEPPTMDDPAPATMDEVSPPAIDPAPGGMEEVSPPAMDDAGGGEGSTPSE